MSRWAAIAFAVLCGALFTGVLEPLTQGRDDSWAVMVTPVAATMGLAFAVRNRLALAGPVVLAAVAAVFVRSDQLALGFLLFLGLPVLLAISGVAIFVARRWRHATRAAAVAFAVAALPVLWGLTDTIRRATAPELPHEVVARLPGDLSLGNLCPDAETPPREARRLRQQGEVLLRELRAHPHSLVPYTYHYSEAPSEKTERITVRELAEEQLRDLENGGPECAPDLQRRLHDAL